MGSGDHYTCTLNELFERKVKESKVKLTPGQKGIWKCPITTTQTPMKQCIDDTLTWAGSFEDAARQVWSILYWVAESGVVFNPDKLVIGRDKLKIFGYNIDGRGIHPTEEMKDAIKGFELPDTIRMMRAFIGLMRV